MGIIEMSAVLVGTFVAILTGFQKIRSHFRTKRRSARQTAKLAWQRGFISVDENGILRSPLLSEDSEVDMFDSPLEEEPLSSLRDKRETMLELTFTRLEIKLRSNGVKVLNGISGSCRPGRVTAIMGKK
jgi:ABC-type multidrug transport system fused ATPase/permease subunit